jgi:hypothetical protein
MWYGTYMYQSPAAALLVIISQFPRLLTPVMLN